MSDSSFSAMDEPSAKRICSDTACSDAGSGVIAFDSVVSTISDNSTNNIPDGFQSSEPTNAEGVSVSSAQATEVFDELDVDALLDGRLDPDQINFSEANPQEKEPDHSVFPTTIKVPRLIGIFLANLFGSEPFSNLIKGLELTLIPEGDDKCLSRLLLPDGWKRNVHCTGMPYYVHIPTRTVTLSAPYIVIEPFKHHRIPRYAIPCLNYRHSAEVATSNVVSASESTVPSDDAPPVLSSQNATDAVANAERMDSPPPGTASCDADKVLTSTTTVVAGSDGTGMLQGEAAPGEPASVSITEAGVQLVSHEEFKGYCSRLFRFKEIEVKDYARGRNQMTDRKERFKKAKLERKNKKLAEHGKVIAVSTTYGDKKKVAFIDSKNPNKVFVLDDYVKSAFRQSPKYELHDGGAAPRPFTCTVSVDGVQYGMATGESKRNAKMNAAAATLAILLPQIFSDSSAESVEQTGYAVSTPSDAGISLFDTVAITGEHVLELCESTSSWKPMELLEVVMKSMAGIGSADTIHVEMDPGVGRNHRLTMKVGRHTAEVWCQNKRTGQQRAAQQILLQMHPHVSFYGPLLRMYKRRVDDATQNERSDVLHSVKNSSEQAARHRPEILRILQDKMRDLHQRKCKAQQARASGAATAASNTDESVGPEPHSWYNTGEEDSMKPFVDVII